ncbi:MAG: hypothetical protein GX606_03865 [Elusimicrobia bacterium]|nr:hypothetical protein [Elusimicrobiota bacterium]
MKHSFLILSILFLCSAGCIQKDIPYTLSEAEKTFTEFCKAEGDVDVTARSVGRTLWVYLPLKISLFNIKASGQKTTADKQPTPLSLSAIDGEKSSSLFSFRYDIIPDALPGDTPPYGMQYNEEFTAKRRILYYGLQESFFGLPEEAAPRFVVIVSVDLSTGIGMKSTLCLADLKKYMTGAIFDDYMLREVADMVGDPALIGDMAGRALERTDVPWAEFLTGQIKQRIRFKFTQSDFKPEADPDRVITTIVANTLALYEFEDFEKIRLYNWRDKREMLFDKEQLRSFVDVLPEKERAGRFTTIKFDTSNFAPGGQKGTGDK